MSSQEWPAERSGLRLSLRENIDFPLSLSVTTHKTSRHFRVESDAQFAVVDVASSDPFETFLSVSSCF